MKQFYFVLIFFVLITQYIGVDSAKILGVFFSSLHSHFLLGNSLLKGLAARGHEVTMISFFDQQPPVKNYRTILLKELIDYCENLNYNFLETEKLRPLENWKVINDMVCKFEDLTFGSKDVQNLLKSNETFDLLIAEQFMSDALRGFQHRYKIPCILFYPLGGSAYINDLVKNPDNPSYVINNMAAFTGTKLTLMQRVENTLIHYITLFSMNYFYMQQQNDILQKYFPDSPHITEIKQNTSLIFLNSHISVGQVKPHLPIMQEVGGIHIREPRKLPEDLQKFLNQAEQGAIYFSLGSNVKSKFLPDEVKKAILKTFSKLNMKVLWKFEDETMKKNISSNIMICKWCPQQDILAHPNIKLFITHGGVMSLFETVYHAKPIVGIPIMADQRYNLQMVERYGYGIRLNYNDLTEAKLSRAINKILSDPSYTINVKKRSAIMHDQQVSPLDRAVYWVEYVLRHNGAYHLRSDALDLEWYQYYLLDVLLVLITPVILICTLIYLGIWKIYKWQMIKNKIPSKKKIN